MARSPKVHKLSQLTQFFQTSNHDGLPVLGQLMQGRFIYTKRIYILSLNYFLAFKRTKPQKNFFFQSWTFFPKTIGKSVVQPRQALAIQADQRSRKKSPTKDKKVHLRFHFLTQLPKIIVQKTYTFSLSDSMCLTKQS